MKTPFLKLLLGMILIILSVYQTQAACTASFTKSISGMTVTFTNTSTTTSGFPNMMMYQWDFGDGTFSTTKNPVKTYSTAGTKIVQLHINDSFGCTKTLFDTIVLTSAVPTCNASFTRSVSGLSVSFTNTSTSSAGLANVHYSWYFSDGLSSTLTNPSVTFPTAGMKVAQLTLYDSSTLCWSTHMDSILVTTSTNSCAANFSVAKSAQTVSLTNTSTNTNGLTTGLSYYWYFSDGTTSTVKHPTKTFSTGGTKTIKLTITDTSQSCFASKMDTVVIPNTCIASFTKTISGLTVTLNNTSATGSTTGTGVTYYWYFSDGTSSTLKNPVKTFASGGTKTVQLSIFDSITGCSASVMDSIFFTSTSTCVAGFTKTISGLTVTLTNTSATGNTTGSGIAYNWLFSDGTTSKLQNPVKTFASAGTKSVQLSIFDSITGCSATKMDSVTLTAVTPTCLASFTRSIGNPKTNVSLNSSASLNSAGTVYNLTRRWYFSDGTSSVPTTSLLPPPPYSKTFTTVGVKWVRLEITDTSTGCTSSQTDTFTLTGNCTVSFSKSVSGLAVTLSSISNTLNAAATKYYWSFSDGTSSTLKYPIKVFATPGLKIITHTVSDTLEGCSATKTDSVMVYSSSTACSASFNYTQIAPLMMRFNSTSTNSNGATGGLTYTWAFSDGSRSTPSAIPTYTYTFTTPGMKWAQLIIQDSSGCTSTRIDSFMVLASSCAANFSKATSGLNVTLTNSSLNANGTATGLSYYWYFSDGTSSTLTNPVKTFATAGYKTINLTISDSTTGCFSSKTDSVFLTSPTCTASFNFALIAPLTVKFASTSTNVNGTVIGLKYNWSFSDGTSATTAFLTKTFASGGVKWAQLIISDSATGCYSLHIDSFMLTSPSCVASYTTIISGLTTFFTNTSVNTNGTATGLKYLWHFGDGTTSDLKNPVHTYATSGVKLVTLTISDSTQGCSSTVTDSVMLSPTTPCAAAFAKSISGLTVAFTNTSVNVNGTATGLRYSWHFGDGTTSDLKNPVHTYASGGLKIINLSISDTATGCASSFTDTVYLSPPCLAQFSLATDTATPFHFFILNTSIIRPGSTFHWDFGDGTTSNLMIPTHTYASFGSYYVCLTVSDTVCTSMFCDTIGMDSNGVLLKQGAFGFETLDFTTVNTTTGTKETVATPEYAIYPNPSNGDVYIDYTMETSSSLTIRVADITGKVVKTKNITSHQGKHTETMDISDLQPAIYFMTIESDGRQKNYKLIKN